MEIEQALQLHPLMLFIAELKEPELKLRSIRNISTIALALGPEKTRQYLLPLLGALFHQETQECQEAILTVLPSLTSYLGGKFYSYLLLQLLMDMLCVYDEKEVREWAFQSLEKVMNVVDIRRAERTICSTLQRLASEKEFRVKELVITMIPQLYIGLSSQLQRQMLDLFQSFRQDEKIEVRVTLAKKLRELIKIMPPAPEQEIKAMLQYLLEDKSERVRLQLVESVILFTQALNETTTQPYFKKLFTDTNPKVRCELYDKLESITQLLSEETLMHFYQHIEQFSELDQEVKNKILSKLPLLLEVYPEDMKQRFVRPLLKPQSSLQLKSTLAEVLCQMNDQDNLGVLLEQSDNEFQMKLLQKIPTISRFGQMLRGLFKHKSWRVRLNILANLEQRLSGTAKIQSPGTSKVESEDFQMILQIVVELLNDKVAVIRSTAASFCVRLILFLKYPLESIPKLLQRYFESQSWFIRLSAVQITAQLLQDRSYLKLWEQLRRPLCDKVTIIRSEAVRAALEIYKRYGMQSCLEECRRELQHDSQPSVREVLGLTASTTRSNVMLD